MTYDPEQRENSESHAKDHLTAIAVRLPSIEDYTKNRPRKFPKLRRRTGIKLKVIASALRVALTGKRSVPA